MRRKIRKEGKKMNRKKRKKRMRKKCEKVSGKNEDGKKNQK